MQYLWERRERNSKVTDLSSSSKPVATQPISSPVQSSRASTPTSVKTHSSGRSPRSVQHPNTPPRPSRRGQPSLFDEDHRGSFFDWDSEEDDAYDRRVARVRLWSRMSIRRIDEPEQPGTHRYSTADRTASSTRSDAGRRGAFIEPSPKTHLSRMSSLSIPKRSLSSASRLSPSRKPRVSSMARDTNQATHPDKSDKHKPWQSEERPEFATQRRPVGNYF